MKRQSIIIFIQGERIETYGNLKKCCEFENLKYHTLSRLKWNRYKNEIEHIVLKFPLVNSHTW